MTEVPMLVALGRLDGEAVLAVRRPSGTPAVAAGGAAHDLDPIGHQVAAVEADAELADQVEVGLARLLLRFELLGELARARVRDRAEVAGQRLVAHADAVVPMVERLLLAVGDQADLAACRPSGTARASSMRARSAACRARRRRSTPARAGRSPCCCRAS